MIAGATRGTGGDALSRHLLKQKDGQQVIVMPARGLAADDLKGQIRELVASAAHGRTDRPVHHVHIDPPTDAPNPNSVIATFMRHYEREFGLENAQRAGVYHVKNGRRHAHVVWSLVRDDGSVVSLAHDHARREKVSRITEHEHGLAFVKGKHNRSAAKALRAEGREDVAAAMEAAGLLAGRRPVAHSTPRQRAQAERTAVPIDEIRNQAYAAWQASDDAKSFAVMLHAFGSAVATGERGLVLVDSSAGTHSLNRVLAAAARAAGEDRITAAMVRKRIAGIWFPTVEEIKNGRAERRNPEAGDGRTGELGELVAAPEIAGRTGRRDVEPDRRVEIPVERNRRNSEPSHDRARTARKRLRDRAAIRQIENIDLQGVNQTKGEIMKAIKAQNFKADLLGKIVPQGFNGHAFSNDLRMVKMPAPGQSTARIMTNDGGWIEVDTTRRVVRTWGPTGRAQVLAAALAEKIGCDVEHLARTAGFSANSEALKVTKMSEDSIKSLAVWWAARGFSATFAPDGCWVNAGRARILDRGDKMEIHGGLTEEAINATLTKAKDAWNGGLYLDGHWTSAEQDAIWIAAQRRGIDVANCAPSAKIQAAWQREQETSAKSVRTISAVRTEMVDAQDLIAAAHGDKNCIIRLPGPLQAFVAIHLDDEQRKFLAAQSIADVIPQLERFRRTGAAELEAWRNGQDGNLRRRSQMPRVAPTKTDWICDDSRPVCSPSLRDRSRERPNASTRVGFFRSRSRRVDSNERNDGAPSRTPPTRSR